MSKYYISEFEIKTFIEPSFDSIAEAEEWINTYIDNLAARDEGLGIKWDECAWRITIDE